jgi:DNA polymerase-1
MRRRLLFDTESNGLLREATKLHCIGLIDVDTGEQWSYGPTEIELGLAELYDADELIGHNLVGHDLPLLWKLYRWAPRPGTQRTDTLIVARKLHPQIKQEDFKRRDYPRELIGSHSLKAWGLRLGEPKDEYNGGWEEFNQDMLLYMEQDVRTTNRLLAFLKPWSYPRLPFDLDHRVAHICQLMEYHGWKFDTEKAQALYVELVKRRDVLERNLIEKFGSWEEVSKVYVAKRDNKKRGIKAGDTVTNYKTVTFNPGSRKHIEKKLRELGWTPREFTESGQAKLDEPILEKIDIPEAQQIIEYLLVQKRLGQLADGDNGWMRMVSPQGFIHAYTNPNGTITGRASHSGPNIAQVPASRAEYGHECRALFTVPTGWKLVGADMKGLELRTLAHYMAAFDKGTFGKVIVEGDVHWFLAQVYEFVSRSESYIKGDPAHDHIRDNKSKRTTYATIYGAGDEKVGLINGGSRQLGRRIKANLMRNLPAYKRLSEAVAAACPKGYLKALDGGKLYIRSSHAALNTLLQGAGAILCKQWLADFYDEMELAGYKFGYDGDYVIVGWIHDEVQVACRPELVEVVGETLVHCARKAGEPFNFRIPLDSTYSSGTSWADTH